eukprot:2250460-Pyramimonas_sp.AAC.1
MILSGCCSRTTLAFLGGITSTAPEPSIAFHSLSSEMANLARSAGLSFLRDTSPPRLAAKTPPS